MSLQVIKSINGQDEYVLLPFKIYKLLQPQIDKVLSDDYEQFDITEYVSNPVALARIKAGLTQLELAEIMQVSQAYISKIEGLGQVSVQVIRKVKKACLQALSSILNVLLPC